MQKYPEDLRIKCVIASWFDMRRQILQRGLDVTRIMFSSLDHVGYSNPYHKVHAKWLSCIQFILIRPDKTDRFQLALCDEMASTRGYDIPLDLFLHIDDLCKLQWLESSFMIVYGKV